jgi:hypothetical protein
MLAGVARRGSGELGKVWRLFNCRSMAAVCAAAGIRICLGLHIIFVGTKVL